jgi:uncharacterized 2Fe-2S/4Fe-4S cluster protein (DUF4445 family)
MAKEKSFHIEFQPLGRREQFPAKKSILDCARRSGIDLVSLCGGKGTCGKCKVQIITGDVTAATAQEEAILSPEERGKGYRLACQTYAQGDLVVNIPAESLSAPQRIQVEGQEALVSLDPVVRSYEVSLPVPSLMDVRGDDERLFTALEQQHGAVCTSIDQEVARALSPTLRSSQWEVAVGVREQEVIALASRGRRSLGMAVDLGTTKIAGYLVDLTTGKTLAATGVMNPQIAYGEDVVARLTHAHDTPAGAITLQTKVVEAISLLAHGLCQEGGECHSAEISEVVVVGNTAMHHLFLRLPVEQLAKAPHVPAINQAVDVKARSLGLAVAPGAYCHLLPNIAGFVGADHVAMLLAVGAREARGPLVAVDIGTNTEISLAIGGEITSVSCASGPAFEGAHVSAGMRAASGAIDHVRLMDGEIRFHTINNAPAAGICGSGIFDTLAQLVANDIIDNSGRMQEGHPRVREDKKGREFVIVSEGERGNGSAIALTQEDVRELQLAKAAISTGIQILLKHRGIAVDDIVEVVIAGAFGSYLDIASAIAIGMFPAIPPGRYRQVGNAAGMGAKAALISGSARAVAQDMARTIRYIELAAAPDFQRTFMQAIALG